MRLRLGLFLWALVLMFPWVLPLMHGRWRRALAAVAALYGSILVGAPFALSQPSILALFVGAGWVGAWFIAFTGNYAADGSNEGAPDSRMPAPERWTCNNCGHQNASAIYRCQECFTQRHAEPDTAPPELAHKACPADTVLEVPLGAPDDPRDAERGSGPKTEEPEATPSTARETPSATDTEDLGAAGRRLRHVANLRDAGLITDYEYQAKRREILDEI